MPDTDRLARPEDAIEAIIAERDVAAASRRLVSFSILIVLLLCLAVAWRWIPLPEGFGFDTLGIWSTEAAARPVLATTIALAVFVVAGLLAVPVTVLVAGSGLVFGPYQGFAIAFAGAGMSALAGYWVGGVLGGKAVRELGGSRVGRISATLQRRGILTTAVLRLTPIAPFTLINLVAGALRIRLRDYAIGTVAGMTPLMLAVLVLTDRLMAAIRTPSPSSLVLLLSAGAGILLVSSVLVRILLRRID